jgi:hypothetical protein
MVTLSKEYIQNLLLTNDHAVGRALVVLNQRQTAAEQSSEATIVHNGEGFRPCDARMGTSMAKFFERTGFLTPKQVAYWRREQKHGARITCYWKQLIEVAEAKRAQS